MPKPIIQPYYCIIKSKKFGEYSLIIREGTNLQHIRNKLKKEGYRVLRVMSTHSLLKIQNESFDEFFSKRPEYNIQAYDFINSIKPFENIID